MKTCSVCGYKLWEKYAVFVNGVYVHRGRSKTRTESGSQMRKFLRKLEDLIDRWLRKMFEEGLPSK